MAARSTVRRHSFSWIRFLYTGSCSWWHNSVSRLSLCLTSPGVPSCVSVRPRPRPPWPRPPQSPLQSVCSRACSTGSTALRAAVGGSLLQLTAVSPSDGESPTPGLREPGRGRARWPSMREVAAQALIAISLTSSNPRNTILITLLIFVMRFFLGYIEIFSFSLK